MYDIKLFAERAGLGLIEFDPETGMFLAVNNSFCNLVGYNEDKLLHEVYTNFLYPDDISSTEQYLLERKNKKIKDSSYINRYVHGKTGEMVTILWLSDGAIYSTDEIFNTALLTFQRY